MIYIDLKFDKTMTSLAGNRFGREIYNSQIEDKITEDGVSAKIPDNIEDIASSFYEGIFAKLTKQYGVDKAHELLQISTKNDYVDEKMKNIRKVYGV